MPDPVPELRALRASMQEVNDRLSFRRIAGAVAMGVFMGGALIAGLVIVFAMLRGLVGA